MVDFDICDGKNRYEPCPKCRIDFGMGLTSRRGDLFVWCASCEHEGPHVPTEAAYRAGDIMGPDKLAFDGWNQAALAAVAAEGS